VSTTIEKVSEDDLPGPFRDGLQALRRTHPQQEIEPVIAVENMVVVSLGTFGVTSERYDEDRTGRGLTYAHDEYGVFVRVPRAFPDWAGNKKGFATSPPLQREGHQLQNNPDWDPNLQEAHEQFHDGDVEWYSWNWDGMPVNQSEDMKFAYDLADLMLQHG